MARMSIAGLVVAACALVVPATAVAQSAITGTVRDISGAALPGVTVEASSPVLIEKVRSRGHQRSRPVHASSTCGPASTRSRFTLPGFNTFVRDGLELPTDFTATINAELRVGALEETVTVTGESPVVDVSSTARVQVLTARRSTRCRPAAASSRWASW